MNIAHQAEIARLTKYNTYVKVPRSECFERTGKAPIGVRWVDVNKGDAKNPAHKSRLVAKEFNNDKRESIFAAMPPLEAKRTL